MPGKSGSFAFSLAMRFPRISSFTLRPPWGATRRSSPNVLGRGIEVNSLDDYRTAATKVRGKLGEQVGNGAAEAGQDVFAVDGAIRGDLARVRRRSIDGDTLARGIDDPHQPHAGFEVLADRIHDPARRLPRGQHLHG